MMIKTKNFHPHRDIKLRCTCGHKDCDLRSVNQYTLNQVQKMRDDLGLPIVITSGGRCPNHYAEVKKAYPGDHQLCYAVDIECDDDLLANKIKVLAGRYGATRVAGEYTDGFIHCAWTPTKRTDVPTWRYRK